MMRRVIKKPSALTEGTVVHDCLEIIYNGGADQWALQRIDQEEQMDPYVAAKVKAIVLGSSSYWPAFEKVHCLETKFSIPLMNPSGNPCHAVVTGKLDGIVTHGGRDWVLEHKTTSSAIGPGELYWENLRADSQASLYILGARSLGYNPVGVLYNVMKKPTLRPLQPNSRRAQPESPFDYLARVAASMTEKPESYFQRQEVVRTEFDLKEADRDLYLWYKRLRAEKENPRNVGACFDWHRACEYFDVCTGVGSIDDDTRYRTAGAKHEELVEG
jgi:hypothetical protein